MAAIPSLPIPSELALRSPSSVSNPASLDGVPLSFVVDAQNKSYKHQYANIYFLRLRLLREFVEAEARRRWGGLSGSPKPVPRVLDVTKGQLCYIIGTVYMEMPLKPNILEDLGRDRSIPALPPLNKIFSPDDSTMLEDESGRIRLVGERLKNITLVTGIIAGVLGMETASGDFEIADVCFAGMAPQSKGEADAEYDEKCEEYLAVVSGLDIGSSTPSEAQTQMLVEFLCGENGDPDEADVARRITRLIVAGNSLAPLTVEDDGPKERKAKRTGQDTSSFSSHPIYELSAYFSDIASSMPVHVLSGASDPSGVIMPQQPLPRAMFRDASSFSTFSCETNPAYISLTPGITDESAPGDASTSFIGANMSGKLRTILATSGQPLNDMFKYIATTKASRLDIAEATLQWRHLAPTAPDTLWCHPFFTADPFVLRQTPDIYVHGCQPHFATKLVQGDGKRCRIILVPSFAETGVLVLVGLRSLHVRTIIFGVEGIHSVPAA
ncbi:DNA polymerase alpha/epsilon subunit B-domain-containing protein [Vararia minispora EC-137]|uniref:DNA polymerase alpha/epsilon subunit B-domain-containing protein n=1 Tax=Vararia minispora EC-137 TaxID=1314806 RepID=A0ACB8QN19_9AGAM|nr:DNA polymerase alpha/epsilon subunit B-domain-containing protein [Vararia minispora EC-137]